MKRYSLLMCGWVVLVIAAASVEGQDRIDWNARAPWGGTTLTRNVQMEQQQKAPFKVFDNVYYVGLQTVCAYLVTTSNGLVLIDSGYAATVDWILDGVRKAGFDPMNIKYILVTHAHLDHAGGAGRMKQLIPGLRVGLSAEDWKVFEDQQSDAQQQRNFPVPLRRDLVLKDGESLTVGDTTFKFYFSPGHTPGATSIEYQVRDRGRSYRALSPGGLGMQFGPPWTPAFKKGMERLKQLGPWDVMLSNHPWLMPKDLAAVEKELSSRGQGPHPGVVGPARINAWFDSVLKVVNDKLASEQGGGQSPAGKISSLPVNGQWPLSVTTARGLPLVIRSLRGGS